MMKTLTRGVALSAALLLLASVAHAQGTEVQAWLGRTVRPNSAERVGFYMWGATAFEVAEYRIASDQLDRSLRDGSVVIDTAAMTPRRTLTFTGEQGEVPAPGLAGVYVYVAKVTAGSAAGMSNQQSQALVVTNLGLAVKRDDTRSIALAHQGERPAAGLRVTVVDTTNGQNRTITTGTTGSNGLAIFTTPTAGSLTFVVRSGTSVAIQQTWDRTWSAQRPTYTAHLQTDRPLYRPGHLVHFRAIVREALAAGGYRTPAGVEFRAFVRDTRGTRVEVGALRASDFGTVSGSYALPSTAGLGEWGLELEPAVADPRFQGAIAYANFGVEAYRKPEFKVAVTADRGSYVQGQTASATIQADYYFGAPVPAGKVRWTVTKRARWRHWNPWLEPMVMRCMWWPTPEPQVVAEGDATTNAQGQARITFDCARDGEDADYEVTAKVTDASDRQITGASGPLPVTRAAFDLVMLSDRWVYRPGDTINLRANLQTTDGKAVAGRPVALEVFAVDPQGARTSRIRRTVTSNLEGSASLGLLARTRANYVVVATARDAAGNVVTAERSFWIHDQTGSVDWAWNQVEVTADKDAYKPGETALLLIRAPVTHGRALVTIEARSIHTAYSVPVTFGLGLLAVPVTAEMAPNVFASVIVPTANGAFSAERELVVPPVDSLVEVTITADKAEYRPGERATFAIKTTDRLGRPVSADVALGVVDEALFALRADGTPELRETFHPRRWDEVTTTGTQGSGGWWGHGGIRLEMAAMSPSMNGAKKAGGETSGQVREYFPDTLRFFASVVTDARGEATVSETLADNLTTWRLTARAVTREAKLGETQTTTLVRKDLIVRLAAPRTLVEGDELELVGIVHNLSKTGADPATVQVRLDAQGVTVLGSAAQSVRVARGADARVTWRVRVLPGTNATLEARGTAPFDDDALRLTLPVAARGVAQKQVEAGSQLADGRVTLRLRKDARAIDPASELRIALTPSLAGGLLDSLDYLVGYPYGCIEQTMSKFLPDVVVAEVLKTMGREDPHLAAELPKMVKDGVDRIAGMQNADGGFGWFANNESHPYVTAYVAYGLALARRNGFAVPDSVIDPALGFLERSLDGASTDLDGRAYQAFALATAGRLRTADLVSLARDRARLGDYAKGVLALALVAANERQLASAVVADLEQSAVMSAGRAHWEGNTVSYGNWTSNPIETTAYVTRALITVNPTSPKVQAAVAWLVERRQDNGQYTTTKDTAAVVLTFAQHVRQTNELDPDLSVSVTVNGQAMSGMRFTTADLGQKARTIQVPASALRVGDNTVVIERTGRGVLYHSVVLDQKVRMDPIPAKDDGIAVRRELSTVETSVDAATGQLVETERPLVGAVKIGQTVRVRLFVAVSKNASVEHVNIEDRFPTGFAVVEAAPQLDWLFLRGWSYWSSAREVHDDKVVFFASNLPLMHPDGGSTFEYRYDLRAEQVGRFLALPATAEAVYTPDVSGRSDGKVITVER